MSKTGKEAVKLTDTRPINVLPWLYKGFELSIKEDVDRDLWKVIGPWQRGFRPGSNTHNNIIDLKEWMTRRKLSRRPSVILYVDIRKAFDHVIRRVLIDKLKETISKEETLDVIKDLISDTSIRIGDTIIPTNVGVPQGALLSPITV